MKLSSEWKEADLLSLIQSQAQESVELDYKQAGALANTEGKKNEISKDVSAMANAAGGTIVYGMAENKHVPTTLDGVDPAITTKEWLEQVINSRIQRKIDGLIINSVALSGTQTGKVAYVVSVPQSLRAPHQAGDKRYYKRYNFESVPMEEYEVRDISTRNQAPDLQVVYELIDNPALREEHTDKNLTHVIRELGADVINQASTPAEYSIFYLYLDYRITLLTDGGLAKQELVQFKTPSAIHRATLLTLQFAIPRHMPIWQGITYNMITPKLQIAFPLRDGKYLLGWEASSPRMSKKVGINMLTVDMGDVKIVPA